MEYACAYSDIGPRMLDTIKKARQALGTQLVDERGYLILDLRAEERPFTLTELQHSLNTLKDIEPGEQYSSKHTLYRGRKGCLRVTNSRNDDVCVPTIREDELNTDPVHALNRAVCVGASGHGLITVNYLIGPINPNDPIQRQLGGWLDPGHLKRSRPEIPGLNTPYLYISSDNYTPTGMHVEDALTGSANLVVAGAPKDWLIVARGSVEKFEGLTRRLFRKEAGTCNQFVRHISVIYSPQLLKDNNIEFDVVRQHPQQLLITLPGPSYHQVINTGANCAVAINYEFDDVDFEPSGYIWCKLTGPDVCDTEEAITKEAFLGTQDDTVRPPASATSIRADESQNDREGHSSDESSQEQSERRSDEHVEEHSDSPGDDAMDIDSDSLVLSSHDSIEIGDSPTQSASLSRKRVPSTPRIPAATSRESSVHTIPRQSPSTQQRLNRFLATDQVHDTTSANVVDVWRHEEDPHAINKIIAGHENLLLPRRLRILQLALQCSPAALEEALNSRSAPAGTLAPPNPDYTQVGAICNELFFSSNSGTAVHSIRRNYLCVLLHRCLSPEIQALQSARIKSSTAKKAANNPSGSTVARTVSSHASSAVLDRYAPESASEKELTCWRRMVKKELKTGQGFLSLQKKLGDGIIACMPHQVAYPCALEGYDYDIKDVQLEE
jgi:hypothetical protein